MENNIKYDDAPWIINNVPCPGEAYNWESVFSYSLFKKEDIKKVIAMREGANDGEDWVMIAELKDGNVGVVDKNGEPPGLEVRLIITYC